MRFPPSFLDEIRARIPVSDVVRQRVALKKQGREWRGLSPFNKEKTPSFFVNDQKGFYHDFSSGKSGDQFTFLVDVEGLSFPEAVERLAQMAGLPLPTSSPEAEATEQKRKSLYEVVELAAKFFESQFAGKTGTSAREYATRRGLKPETLREFRIGYAPANRFALKEYLGSQGIPVEDMIEVGLLVAGDDIPIPYDRFRDRLIIPIHDFRGQVIAFGGRALAADAQAKYLNSPETTLFHKGSTVFNFHRARRPAHEDGSIVVVEGYMDAIAIYQAGLKSVVASMGTALTEEQIGALWRLSPEPIVCFDADRAGVAAAHRAIDRVLPLMKVGQNFRFALLRGDKDPDDLIREKGLDAFMALLRASLPLWDVLWEREAGNAVVDTAGDQVALEQKLITIIRTIKEPTVQRSYLNICRLELARLFWQATKARRKKLPISTDLRLITKGRRRRIKRILLGLLVHYPEFVEEKADAVCRVTFETDLDAFWTTLYDLLVVYKELSVQLIYERMKPKFFDILEEIHGHKDESRNRGYNLMRNFPIVKIDPPVEFISCCIDHLIDILYVDQMAAEIEDTMTSLKQGSHVPNDDEGTRLLQLVREHHLHLERVNTRGLQLAEEAEGMKKPVLGPTEYSLPT